MPFAVDRLLDAVAMEYHDGVLHYAAMGQALAASLGLADACALAPSLALEPWLFSHAVAKLPARAAAQLAYAYRPAGSYSRRIDVEANTAGIAVVPKLGYAAGAMPGEQFVLERCPGDVAWQRTDGRPLDFFPPVLGAPGTIDLAWSAVPAVEALWPQVAPMAVIPTTALAALARSLDILATALPDYAALITRTTRRILLFENAAAHSFAADAAYGAAFINIAASASEPLLIEEIAHQCGHVLFSALTYDPDEWLAADANELCLEETLEGRSVYTKLHGVFTEAMMLATFDACLTQDLFVGADRHELLGRAALIFRRMHYDLASIAQPALYTPRGQQLFDLIYAVFADVRARRIEMLTGFDFSGQPYTFDYRTFRALNPA
jgi:hypothetical protein